ncbi:MAG: hypothetical protein C4581_03175 [Nitrospiraceae bacterium]|nr:MAG: hypothetical protein C4581_03175 [Nitrospiraceae bacterium]
MNDKTSIINAAQKFTAKGLIDKAIAEWEKLLTERNDGNIHNTIGDLYLKKGADQDAAKSFNKAAEIFRKDGFYPKAIAIYKKVLNITPNDTDTLIALARLNAERGLTGNAIENYYRAAEIYNKEGSTEKAITIVDKMLKLSGTNIITRAKIAYLYFRLGLRERAANEYASIALHCMEEGDIEKAKEFFDKSLEYDPASVPASIGLSRLALMNKNPAQAFDTLDHALSRAPDNVEVLAAYAKLALETDKHEAAKKALETLQQLDPSSQETRRLLGSVYLKEGLTQKAFDELLPVIDAALDAEEWSDAHGLLHSFRGLQTVPVKQRLLRICRAQGDEYTISSELKALAALLDNEGASEDALRLFKEALSLNADDHEASEKINELEIRLGIAQPSINIEIETAINVPAEEFSIEENIPFELNTISEESDHEIAASPADLPPSAEQEGPSRQTAADDDLQALFAQFESPVAKKIDYEAHYVAGLEFRQKGLLDEAVKELRTATGDPDKFQRNATMLALCYMEKKAYPLAIAEFNKIIDKMTPDDSTYLRVKYELANAHVNNKDVNRALELYSEIHALEPDFKDVAVRIASLEEQKTPAADREELPKPKKDRVSYI